MINAILYSEINLLCVLFLLLLSVKVSKSMFLQGQRQTLFKVAISNVLFLLLDSVWIFVNNNVFGISILINWVLNGLYYILSGFLGYYWFQFSETVQESKLVRDCRYRRIAVLPMVLLAVGTLLSFKTGWLFYIDDQNCYHRGAGYAFQLLTSYGYVVFTAVKAFYLSFHTDDYRRKSELKILATFGIPTLFAGAIQVSFPGIPVLCIGNTFGILYVYLTLQEQLISLDALTKLNNRNQLFQYLSTKLSHLHEDKALHIMLLVVVFF